MASSSRTVTAVPVTSDDVSASSQNDDMTTVSIEMSDHSLPPTREVSPESGIHHRDDSVMMTEVTDWDEYNNQQREAAKSPGRKRLPRPVTFSSDIMSSGRWANTPARIALLLQPVVTYFMKWRGVAGKAPAERRKWADMMFTCFIIVFVIWSLSFFSWRIFTEEVFAMSFVASAALIFGTPDAPNAQPRSVIGSHMLAAFIGNTVRICLIAMNGDVLYGSGSWWYPLFTGLSIGLTAFSMSALRIFHPPACSTAMLALQLSEELSPRVYGYAFMITPMFVGSATLCVFGMVFNNMFRSRNYPMYW